MLSNSEDEQRQPPGFFPVFGPCCALWRPGAAPDACWSAQAVRWLVAGVWETHPMAGPLGLGPCVFQTLRLDCSERNSLSSPLPAYPRAELLRSVCLSREPLSGPRVWGGTLHWVGSALGDVVSTALQRGPPSQQTLEEPALPWVMWWALLCSIIYPHSGPWRNLHLPFCCSEVVKTAAKPLCLAVPSV